MPALSEVVDCKQSLFSSKIHERNECKQMSRGSLGHHEPCYNSPQLPPCLYSFAFYPAVWCKREIVSTHSLAERLIWACHALTENKDYLPLIILFRHWSMSLRSHVRYAREAWAFTLQRQNEHDRIGIRVGQPKIGRAPDSLAPDQWLHRISVKLRLKVSFNPILYLTNRLDTGRSIRVLMFKILKYIYLYVPEEHALRLHTQRILNQLQLKKIWKCIEQLF